MAQPQLRRSQLVTTFGPGCMIDLPERSVIVAGLDHWQYDNSRIPGIEEPRLVEKLRAFLDRDTVTLRTPPPAPEHPSEPRTDVTAWEFPNWFIVQELEQFLARVHEVHFAAAVAQHRSVLAPHHAGAVDGHRLRHLFHVEERVAIQNPRVTKVNLRRTVRA